jgi:holo-[acyl-carrier protein] synthase
MLTVGIDSVDIERFIPFMGYSVTRLLRIYTAQEITYCLQEPVKTAERLAARFAAKEAFYKALIPRTSSHVAFLTVCSACSLQPNERGIPLLVINKDLLGLNDSLDVQVSVTHTSSVATAIVILS